MSFFMTKTTEKPKSFRFSPSELELLDAARAQFGSYKAGIVAALHLLEEKPKPTNDELLAMLAERLK